ncbi:MAG TPA: tetratricopeptide repeat protein [Usitatibacter sp.]|nr:tetratricopeptide repeat protein [Usitatibacter sp.]
MATIAAPAARVAFPVGDWLANPATNELRRGAEVVRVEPRAMDLLAILAERRGEVVGREELLAAAWPGVVVGDEALSQSIAKLRRALGDDPRAPSYIETIAKRGYRLKAAIAEPGAAKAMAAHRKLPRYGWGVLAVLAMALAAVALYFPGDTATRPGQPAPSEPAEAGVTVTVLPFESIGGDGSQSYLARGMGDSLMTELGRLSGLRVIHAGVPGGEAAKRARYSVSGSVQREGGVLRIHARLTDTRNGEQLWSERYERPFGELFPVQDEIIRHLTAALPTKVSDAERQRLARRHTRSLEAYDQFLRAQALFLVRGPRENAEAREHYRKAIELDPRFARAYAGLALAHAMDHRLNANAHARASLDRARELAETARDIDPEIAEVHWALGFVHAQARRHREAGASLERAIALTPSFADAHALLGGIHTYMGEAGKSIGALRTALRYKPDGGYLVYLLLGRAYYFLGDTEQALINLREAQARNPADVEVRLFTAAALAERGDGAAAAWEMEEVRSLEPGYTLDAWLQSYPLSDASYQARLRKALERL